nr:MAG: putative capsid protein [Gammacarmovirus sp.]
MARNRSRAKQNKIRLKSRTTIPKGLSVPMSVGGVIAKRDPIFANTGNSVTITNTERFSDVGTSATSGAYADAVIPMIPSAFPWLSGAAVNYSKWQWEYLEVIYIPQCSTTTNGLVGMAFLYDPRDGPITSMSRLSSFSGSVLNPPWAGSEGATSLHTPKNHPNAITMKPDSRVYKDLKPYIAATTFNGLSQADQLLYCPVWIDTATANSTSLSTVVGGLYLKYRIMLRDPLYSLANN